MTIFQRKLKWLNLLHKAFVEIFHKYTQKMSLKGKQLILNKAYLACAAKRKTVYTLTHSSYLEKINTCRIQITECWWVVFCFRKPVFGVCTLVPKQHLLFHSKCSRISLYFTYVLIHQSAHIRRKSSLIFNKDISS